MEIALYIVLGLALLAAGEGVASQRALKLRIEEAQGQVPIDPVTGLLDHRAFEQRVYGEIKRAVRFDGNVWLGVWAVVSGDTDAFGRELARGLTFPEVAFRLAPDLFCCVRPNIDSERRVALVERVDMAAARHVRFARSETVHRAAGGKVEARQVLHRALEEMRS